MFSSNHTFFFVFTLLLHAVGILIIVSQITTPCAITMAELELTAVELNLTDAADNSPPSPPPLPAMAPEPEAEPPTLEPEPEPEPPEPIPLPIPPEPIPMPPEPAPLPVALEPEPMVEPEQVPLPVNKPVPPPTVESQPTSEPKKPLLEPQPKPPAQRAQPKAKVSTEEKAEPQPIAEHTPVLEMPESNTPESGAASAQIDLPPRPRKTIKPVYPSGARRRGEEGSVTLNVTISASGEAINVEVTASSGYPELDQAARHAVQRAQFTPGKIGTQPVESSAGLTIIFKLR